MFYIWPAVVFHGHLKGRSLSYRFAFCYLASIAVWTTVISVLGVFKLLYVWLAAILFYGSFAVQLLRFYNPFPLLYQRLKSINHRTMTWRRLLLNAGGGIKKGARGLVSRIWAASYGRRLRYFLLAAALLYGTLYFSWSALQIHSFGASDQYVHNAWIYALTQGTIYPKGVYPEGMHCMIYMLSCMFGIKIYSINLFLAGVHAHALLISAYLLMKEFFRWSGTPLMTLYIFLTVRLISVDSIGGVSRLAWTIPQEFGFAAVFLCTWALIRYLKRPYKKPEEGERRGLRAALNRACGSGDLIVFLLAVSATIMIHFYATIIAVFLCAAAFIVYVFRYFHWKKVLNTVCAALLALLLAAGPMGLALAAGYGFQGSIRWAVAVTKGGEDAWAQGNYDPEADYLNDDLEEEPEVAEKEKAEEDEAKDKESSGSKPAEKVKKPLVQRIKERLVKVYNGTWQTLYPGSRGLALCIASVATAALSFAGGMVLAIARFARKKKGKKYAEPGLLSGYLCIALTLILLMTEYAPRLAGLPIFISGSRLCSVIALFAAMIYLCIPDLVLSGIAGLLPAGATGFATAVLCTAIYAAMALSGNLHGYLYYELTRYPASVDLTTLIVQNVQKDMFTIVSTTDDYYQILGHGFHEEIVDLMEQRREPGYKLPTPYIFVYIEKKPLYYAQSHFASGPDWLGNDSYAHTFIRFGNPVSIYPKILCGETSDELVKGKMEGQKTRADAFAMISNRQVLESRVIQWYRAFSSAHPREGALIYEDDEFMCYCIRQNPYSLLSLGVVEK